MFFSLFANSCIKTILRTFSWRRVHKIFLPPLCLNILFPHIHKAYFYVFFPLNRLVHLVLLSEPIFRLKMEFCSFQCKKLTKFIWFKPIEVPIKKYTFQIILKIYIFGPQIWHTFLRNLPQNCPRNLKNICGKFIFSWVRN